MRWRVRGDRRALGLLERRLWRAPETGHPDRLARATCGARGNALEEGTVLEAQRIVLRELGFSSAALAWHVGRHEFPVDWPAAREAACWVLAKAGGTG